MMGMDERQGNAMSVDGVVVIGTDW